MNLKSHETETYLTFFSRHEKTFLTPRLVSSMPFQNLQGVRGQSGFFYWALRERNIQVRLYLKVVLKS